MTISQATLKRDRVLDDILTLQNKISKWNSVSKVLVSPDPTSTISDKGIRPYDILQLFEQLTSKYDALMILDTSIENANLLFLPSSLKRKYLKQMYDFLYCLSNEEECYWKQDMAITPLMKDKLMEEILDQIDDLDKAIMDYKNITEV